jgi:cytochrome bd ubiquinol oxidase subunit II
MLAFAWWIIIGFAIVMYVILDGFTLGAAMLLPFLDKVERDIAISMILPNWDGNQTWLVFGVASLYGAFPLAFSILLPVFYVSLLIMVTSLLLRGVALEFRLKSVSAKRQWDIIFSASSLCVTISQGYLLACYIQGLIFVDGQWQSVNLNFIFLLSTIAGLVGGYALLGSTRLILKTSGRLQEKMYLLAPRLVALLFVAMVSISVMTPILSEFLFTRWFDPRLLYKLALLPLFALGSFILLLHSLICRKQLIPFWSTVAIFLSSYIGFIISIFPYIVPYTVTYQQAASPTHSLEFIMYGAVIMLPVLLVYTGYGYRIFSGKVDEVLHY